MYMCVCVCVCVCVLAVTDMKTDRLILVEYIVCVYFYDIISLICVL